MKLLLLLCCCLPLRQLRLNSPYGYRVHPLSHALRFHYGIALGARHDTVFAITGGEATLGYDTLLGIHIKINDGELVCLYGHLSAVLTGPGPVRAGDPVAITGATGRVTGEHLHLSIYDKGRPVNPLEFLYQSMIKSNPHEQ